MSTKMKHRFPQNKKAASAAGDDRNLVLVDDDFQDADFEDRVWLFWQRHGKKTVAAATALFLAIIGAIVYVEVGEMRISGLQAEYATLQTPEQKLAFADANKKDPIAGTAYYSAAQALVEEGKFAEAAAAYENAARVLSQPEFLAMSDRAKIAQAACLARINTPEATAQSQDILKKLAGSPATDSLYRGQAMYELATSALSAGNIADARLWINEMDRSLDAGNVWQERKRALLLIEPKLTLPDVPADQNS